MIRCLLSLLCAFVLIPTAWSQPEQLSNRRVKIVQLPTPTKGYALDSLTILPHSLEVIDPELAIPVDSSFYSLRANRFHWHPKLGDKASMWTTLKIRYKVLPFDLYKKESHLDSSRIKLAGNGDYIGFNYTPYEPEDGIIDFKGLDYNGSFSREISFGNSQNLVLNSNFNLQLAGELGDGIEILAAITDNNIPLQPEGNTQQLQEFDKIFIQLKKKDNVLIAGDYELKRPDSYFMNYFKKLQGATFSNQSNVFKKGKIKSQGSLAVARGKFSRNTLPVAEGNQGPYRLRGQEGERFIIALAGTEKVYLDGVLLQRGLEKDYVIDYNRADISFTNKRLITKDSRIIVEFEYADQQFLRSMYALNTEYQDDKLRLHFNFYSEQDNKNSGGVQDLDSLKRATLRNIGDDLENAFVSSVDTIEEFNDFRIQYKMVDTSALVKGEIMNYSVLFYTTNPDSATHTATFTNVGDGMGNYILDQFSSANGRLYIWVSPDEDGNLQGNYNPVIRLIAPNQKQMYTLGADYAFSKKSKISTEVALSKNDRNRFSSIDGGDDLGGAFFMNYDHQQDLGKTLNLEADVKYEHVQQNFQALNPYRPAEFTRDWNLSTLQNEFALPQKENEHLTNVGVSINKKDLGKVRYEFGAFLRGAFYTGTKHSAKALLEKKGFKLDANISLLEVDSDPETSQFFRPNIDFSKTFKKWGNWKLGVFGEREKNERISANTDTLNNSSFYFDRYRIYFESPLERKWSIGLNYSQRFDYVPIQKDFVQNTIADEFNLYGKWSQGSVSQINWNFTHRKLRIIDPTLTNLDPQNSSLGRLNHSLNILKGVIRSTTIYEIGSGQEAKIEYNYLPVNPGEGVFFWDETLDENNDGVPQINEIRNEAFPGEGNIIRVTIYTDDFIKTNNVSLNQSLRLEPRKIWNQKKGLKKVLSKFSTQSTLRVARRTREDENISPWNPFQLSVADTSLVSVTSSIRNSIFFNRANPKYDLQVGMSDNRNKVILTSGGQSRRLSEQFFRGHWNISQKISTQLYLVNGQQVSDAAFFDNQDYKIDFIKIEPKFTFLPVKNFRTILTYQFRDSQNKIGENEKAIQHNFNLETTFNQTSKTSVRLNLSFVKVAYTGERNTQVEFAVLEGLKDGQNYLWSLIYDRRLSKNIQMSISYEGRKTGIANTVHLGRAQVRATF